MMKKEDLGTKGIKVEDNYNYKDNKYFKFSMKHLTDFTGNYNENKNNNSYFSELLLFW